MVAMSTPAALHSILHEAIILQLVSQKKLSSATPPQRGLLVAIEESSNLLSNLTSVHLWQLFLKFILVERQMVVMHCLKALETIPTNGCCVSIRKINYPQEYEFSFINSLLYTT